MATLPLLSVLLLSELVTAQDLLPSPTRVRRTPTNLQNGTLVDDLCIEHVNSSCVVDNHTYYKAVYTNDSSLWIEINPGTGEGGLPGVREGRLSMEYLSGVISQPISVKDYLYYGLPIYNITILTGGFISLIDATDIMDMVDVIKTVMSISPLLGDFNPSLSNDSNIFTFKNASLEIVQWDRMRLNDTPSLGAYTFQVQFWDNFDIVFAYKEVPSMDKEKTGGFTVGISDAYFRKTPNNVWMHMYSRIDADQSKIGPDTAIRFVHMKLCTMLDNCHDCLTEEIAGFDCVWCPARGKCSDSSVLHRDWTPWIQDGCNLPGNSLKAGDMCREYCYYEASNHTTYIPTAPDSGLMKSQTNGSSMVKVVCEENYSVSVAYKMTAGNEFACTTGGQKVPVCLKSCQYSTSPGNGQLQSIRPNTALKPGANYSIVCNAGHRLHSGSNHYVVCTDDGTLQPDPSDVRCEKYCTLPHHPNFVYYPPTHDPGFLHEGQTVTMGCKEFHAFEEWFTDTSQGPRNLTFTCNEAEDLSSKSRSCVGYCTFEKQPNITYSTFTPKVGETVNMLCQGVLRDIHNSQSQHGFSSQFFRRGMKSVKCERAGVLEMPVCVMDDGSSTSKDTVSKKEQSSTNGDRSLIVVLVLFLCMVVAAGLGWVTYAYRHPSSPSGLFLIEHCRPWTWRRDHAYRRHEESLAEVYHLDGDLDL